MKPRKIMIHIESLNNIPIKFFKKENLILSIFDCVNKFNEELNIDQITVQVVKPEK